MDYSINSEELAALCGLPHLQQLAYFRGIRPYMDVKSGLVGVKRGISFQSIAEQLYVEPHQGIKSESYSRAQVRRAISALARVGVITPQSEGLTLILKCNLATRGYSAQNKVVTKQSQQAVTSEYFQFIENIDLLGNQTQKPDIARTPKADTPLKLDFMKKSHPRVLLVSTTELMMTVISKDKYGLQPLLQQYLSRQ